MKTDQSIQKINALWKQRKETLTKKEIALLSTKDSPRAKMVGIFSPRYYKRTALIKNGDVVFGHSFKEYRASSEDVVVPTWVLFSPSTEVNSNPGFLEKAAQKLLEYVERLGKKALRDPLASKVADNWSSAFYCPLPEEMTDGKLIYLSIVFVSKAICPPLGTHCYLINKKQSKEILYLPDSFLETKKE